MTTPAPQLPVRGGGYLRASDPVPCDRCHARAHLLRIIAGALVCEPCLTPTERAHWRASGDYQAEVGSGD